MQPTRANELLSVIVIFCLASTILLAGDQAPSEGKPLEDAEGVVTELYELVTFEVGALPDWQKVRSLFIDEAIVVLRTSRDKTTVFSLEGFVDDFKHFIENSPAKQQGFTERVIRTKSMTYGDIAHVLVLYEASITGSPRPPTLGVDSFQLTRRDGNWRVVSITNEVVTPNRPVPTELKE